MMGAPVEKKKKPVGGRDKASGAIMSAKLFFEI